jgi:hypothetical protein
MKLVYTCHDGFVVDYLRRSLEGRGIGCLLKNQFLQGAVGELPPTECWPELWVFDDGDLPLALEIVENLLAPEQSVDGWTCVGCGEVLEAQFHQCWHCGSIRAEA